MGHRRKTGIKRGRQTQQPSHDPGNVPWPAFHALVHEARSPLTVVAYASEILLDTGRTLPSQAVRRHVESIHHACHEASACITLLSRCIEVEQAGQDPVPEPFPVEAFRDPDAHVPGPAIEGTGVAHLDLRLAGNLAITLWEMASLLPGTRPTLAAVEFDARELRLRLHAPGLPGDVLTEPAPSTPRNGRGVASPADSFPVGFRARLVRRCLTLLGGSMERIHAGKDAGDVLIRIPLHAPGASKGKKPSKTSSNPCK